MESARLHHKSGLICSRDSIRETSCTAAILEQNYDFDNNPSTVSQSSDHQPNTEKHVTDTLCLSWIACGKNVQGVLMT
jgi:hypothetical protein